MSDGRVSAFESARLGAAGVLPVILWWCSTETQKGQKAPNTPASVPPNAHASLTSLLPIVILGYRCFQPACKSGRKICWGSVGSNLVADSRCDWRLIRRPLAFGALVEMIPELIRRYHPIPAVRGVRGARGDLRPLVMAGCDVGPPQIYIMYGHIEHWLGCWVGWGALHNKGPSVVGWAICYCMQSDTTKSPFLTRHVASALAGSWSWGCGAIIQPNTLTFWYPRDYTWLLATSYSTNFIPDSCRISIFSKLLNHHLIPSSSRADTLLSQLLLKCTYFYPTSFSITNPFFQTLVHMVFFVFAWKTETGLEPRILLKDCGLVSNCIVMGWWPKLGIPYGYGCIMHGIWWNRQCGMDILWSWYSTRIYLIRLKHV